MDMNIGSKDTRMDFICPKILFMTKTSDVIMNCFISAAFFVQFPFSGYWSSSIM